jgi:exosortase
VGLGITIANPVLQLGVSLQAIKTRINQDDWVKLGIVAAAAVALYAPVMAKLAQDWWHNPNYSQGFLIPPLAAYLVWDNRQTLADTPSKPSNWGLAFALGAAAVLFLGSLGAELFLTRISLVLMLASLVVFLFGWQWLRRLLFPLAVLLMMIPIPEIIFNQIALPLQLAATRLAGGFLSLAGVPAFLDGNLIELPNSVTLEVAEACSGIRSLMALLALGVTYAYFFDSRRSVRWILVAATLPIAIVANGVRIAGTGVLTYLVSQDAAEGYFHVFSGWLVFVVAFLMFVALHKLISLFWRDPKRAATT